MRVRHCDTSASQTQNLLLLICRLMVPQWHRLVHKASDFFFFIDLPGNAFWHSHMFELFLLTSFSLWFDTDRGGVSNRPYLWWKWERTCSRCAEKLCSRVSSAQTSLVPVDQAWHSECYTCQGNGRFPIAVLSVPWDEAGDRWWVRETEKTQHTIEYWYSFWCTCSGSNPEWNLLDQ